MRFLTAITASMILSACALGPDFMRPLTAGDEQDQFLNEAQTPENPQSMNAWWTRINDPLLDTYINDLLAQNLSLKQASERVIQAAERTDIERSALFPNLSGGGSASRQFTPGSSFNNGLLTSDRIYTNNVNVGLDAAWEIDLFGRIRRSTESARASFRASIYDREALAHSLIADVLERRVAIAVNAELLDLAVQNAQNRKQFYDLVESRYELGASETSASDVLLARENYASVQADIHSFQRLLADEIFALDVLLGQPPGTTNPLVSDFPVLAPPRDVAICVPAALLDRRPDLRASELRVKAANADIGVAIADLYPTLNLAGSLGFSDNEATTAIFNANQLAGSILADITMPLFNAGALRSNVRIQESEARELAAAYAENVLNAMREVESALVAEHQLEAELKNLALATKSLKDAEVIGEDRYKRGVISLTEFLDIQQRRYTIEQSYLRLQQTKWNTRIALYLALGGDWLSEGNNENMPACRAPSAENEET